MSEDVHTMWTMHILSMSEYVQYKQVDHHILHYSKILSNEWVITLTDISSKNSW